jgi:hypothetical protein
MIHKIKHISRHVASTVSGKVVTDNERGARYSLLEELFNDFHRSRFQIYKVNFVRGLFFGFGSVIGGTLVVAALVWLLTVLVHVFPPMTNLVNDVIQAVQGRS